MKRLPVFLAVSLGLIWAREVQVQSATSVSGSVALEVVSEAASYSPAKEPRKKKRSYLQRIKNFFGVLLHRLLNDNEPLVIILGILLALIGLTPFAIMIAGLIRKNDDWLLHFLINFLIAVIAWVLFFVTCGFGVWITLALLLVAFIHALWYVLARK
ncbi:MAG: hypothetical protein D6750_02140 [Bacteroidetes bacterium]|nr:MAG: hypothetical protein D6750_02140 [Bacteroidota bacterium]